jgi:hypothetical protein
VQNHLDVIPLQSHLSEAYVMTFWSLRGAEGQFVFLNAEKSIRNVLTRICFFLSRTTGFNNERRTLRCHTKTTFTWMSSNHQVHALMGNRRGCRTNVSCSNYALLGFCNSLRRLALTNFRLHEPNYLISLTWSSRYQPALGYNEKLQNCAFF